MSEYAFAVARGNEIPSDSEIKRRDRIAHKIGGACAGYVVANIPGQGRLAWGFLPNRGEPFDREMAAEIIAAWKRPWNDDAA